MNGIRLTKHAYNVFRKAGIKYRVSHGGRTTIVGRGRAPKSLFPKARFGFNKITY